MKFHKIACRFGRHRPHTSTARFEDGQYHTTCRFCGIAMFNKGGLWRSEPPRNA